MDSFEITEQDREELIEHYSLKLKQLEEKVVRYQNLLNKLKGKPSSGNTDLKSQINSVVGGIKGYEVENMKGEKPKVPKQNWKQLCLGSLKEINAFVTTQEIYEFVVRKNPTFIKYDKEDMVAKLSTALSNLYPKGTVRRINNPLGRGYFWALPIWYSPELISYYKKKLALKYGLDEESLFNEGKSKK
ncbi:hypothetical protein AB9K32_05400 [Allomuricauda sp. XS_ASV26]|uniref:hypothetical protein n=1 Tax=Allomuricauda sp. XS_ASV26 TaxID=3241292 RepID=UPI003515EFA4